MAGLANLWPEKAWLHHLTKERGCITSQKNQSRGGAFPPQEDHAGDPERIPGPLVAPSRHRTVRCNNVRSPA